MKHTALPWEIVSKFVGPLIIKSGNTEIAHVGGDSFALVRANAAHIVKCVNLHGELVEALKDAHPYIASDALRTAIGDLIVKAEATNA